jgi:hypothetical protein
LRVGALLAPLTATPLNHVSYLGASKRLRPTVCGPARVLQDYDFELPEGMTAKPIPEPINIEVPFFSYRRDWKLEGQHLRSRTEIVSTFETRACPADLVNPISEALEKQKDKFNPLVQLIASEPSTQP